ncbi:iron-sulfur cluster assembly accessory protein [Pseudomonadales bacterium]|jgi:iron-sulfur cluster assembly accessory protein|nr:iron-sulfur cluster assembly accessory protein [Pseudomonadales bacterium]MDB2646718.1 iron-sulfur cluster assembly accessory protein [Pseudomonadales bacterium]
MNTHITVSPTACDHIRKQVELTRSRFLRLGVKESGCNGYMYTLDFLEDTLSDDIQVEVADGVNICIHQEDVALVTGTEIDMVTQGLNSALVFKNSNAQSYCGCGESFALSDQDTNGGEGGENSASVSDLATDATAQT